IKYQKRTIVLVNTDDITSELLGIKNMGSSRLLYNRYNIKRSVMITTWKRSRSLGINTLGKLVECGFYKTKGFDMIGSFSGIKSFSSAF
ncbi:MAG TPA: hypothetical protein PK048_04660, partial [Candidatus Absconditabacterales bacterium]|nr:hypothetical protein [Candidatus Absconditabacterales bacterium]